MMPVADLMPLEGAFNEDSKTHEEFSCLLSKGPWTCVFDFIKLGVELDG